MCGIVGLFHPTRPLPPEAGLLRRMTDAIAHRGPDGEGFHAEPHCGFGHRRLSIVDLAGGAQPMATEDGAVTVCFNGEIYNYAALRRDLEAAGHRFRTRSDTESLLHGWREWGLGLLDRAKGMFAFGLWDRERGELLLARDRLGEKPLLYGTLPDGTFAFASEMAGLLALPGMPRRLDPAALDDYLALGYVPDPATIYSGIRRLPAGHFLLLKTGEPALPAPRRYWRPPTTPMAAAPADAATELHRRLDAAVRAQLMSDVPLGAFLSGGVDSSAVVACAARAVAEAGTGPLATFTIGFEGSEDERPAAAALAARLGLAAHAEAGSVDYVAAAREQARIFGEPYGDHSAVPTLMVCRLARRHVTVALSGDGGDEVFAGYRRYRFHALAEAARQVFPTPVRKHVIGGLAAIYPKLDRAPRWLRAKTTLTEISLDSALGYYRTACKIEDARRRGFYAAPLRTALDGHDPAARFVALMGECDERDGLLQAQYADLHTYLPGDILVKTDRASMAVSLELRPPILDHELVEWGMALPAALKLRDGVGKYVLREAMGPLLPAELLWGKKRGFADRIGDQFRTQAATVRARLAGGAMADSGLFDTAALARLAEEHASGRFDHAQAIWQLLVLEGFLAGQEAVVPAAAEPVGA
ncbi:asparagine synthase (glutamine-hydrolyzing) [Paracraurococcus ruber]|uniref:asparagine synthase (glutamine-hydrolyzing) n=1 Tax=Paracraurococcus ruber TaxID=77675 RepID=A0ABS1CV89_9PROT|nr:asparagine synthase (glutamine-hydrolyzing) [Paracraurococcus ruber]MBK1658288.1 asparagine synthase (glutamine-hydrolyzing) [Paracraurococcus ruber]TDG31007.1 asparagine synthase (glutamine-hydrolyzing) [Paracraurococcus ruber]